MWILLCDLGCLFTRDNSSKCPGSISYIYFWYFRNTDTQFEPSGSVFLYPETNRPSSLQHPSWLQINLSVSLSMLGETVQCEDVCVCECGYKAHNIKMKIGCEKKNSLKSIGNISSGIFLVLLKYNSLKYYVNICLTHTMTKKEKKVMYTCT